MALFAGPAAADKVADIEKELSESQTKLKSFTAKTKSTQDMDLGGGNSLKSDNEGTYEWMQKDGTVMFRIDMTGSSVQVFGGQEMKSTSSTTMINDGTFVYTLSEQNGQKSAYKMKADPKTTGDVKYFFEGLRTDYTVKVLPDEKVDGHDCYVIEAMANETENNPMVKQVHYLCKDLAMAIKTIGSDKKGKVTFTSEMADIKKDAKISSERFVFKAPAGVEVMDMPGQ
ncbi:MAG: LolA family protein [Planctomycetota bacterium]